MSATAKTFKSVGPPAQRAAYSATDVFEVVGETVNAAEGEFLVEKLASANHATAKVLPTREDALQAKGTRTFAAVPKAVLQELKSDEHLALELTYSTTTQSRCQSWTPTATYAFGQLACDWVTAAGSACPKMYPVYAPDWTAFVTPVGLSAGHTAAKNPTAYGPGGAAAGGAGGALGLSLVYTTATTAITGTRAEQIAITTPGAGVTCPEDLPTRDVRTTPRWKAGLRYRRFDAAAYANATWECATPASCGKLAPGSTGSATTWIVPAPGPKEIAYLTTNSLTALSAAAPASLKQYAKAYKNGYESYETAYVAGSIAVSAADGLIYECDPEAISGVAVTSAEKLLLPAMESIVAGTTKQFEVYLGCTDNAPGTDEGAAYWQKSGVPAGKVQPLDLEFQPFNALDGGYQDGDLTVSAGTVWRCDAADYCGEAPATAGGKRGWAKTPYVTTGVTNYDATGATKKLSKWLRYTGDTKFGPAANYPYVAGESQLVGKCLTTGTNPVCEVAGRQISELACKDGTGAVSGLTGGGNPPDTANDCTWSSKCYLCLDAVKCRAQATRKGDSSTGVSSGAWKETTADVAGSGAAGSADLFASKYAAGCKSGTDAEKASELKYAGLSNQRRVVAQLYNSALAYKTGEVVAAAGTEGYAWACNAAAGCPVTATPTTSANLGTAAGTWRLLRAKAAGSCHPKAATSLEVDKAKCAAKSDLQNDTNTACIDVGTTADNAVKCCDWLAADAVTKTVITARQVVASEFKLGTRYKKSDYVLAGDTVYMCLGNPASARVALCASTDPRKDLTMRDASNGLISTSAITDTGSTLASMLQKNKGGLIWQETGYQATLTPLAARVAVEAIPLRELLRGTKARGKPGTVVDTKNGGPLALRKGQHFQQDGVVFTCELPKICATALLALKAAIELSYVNEAKPIKPKYNTAGSSTEKGKPLAAAWIAKSNTLQLINAEFVNNAVPAKNAFTQSYNVPKKAPKAWGTLALTDPVAMEAAGLALACDLRDDAGVVAATEGQLFLKGDVYCASSSDAPLVAGAAAAATAVGGRAWRCAKPLLCGLPGHAPTSGTAAIALSSTAAGTGAWVAVPSAGDKLWVAKAERRKFSDNNESIEEVVKTLDWKAVTDAAATSTLQLGPGDLATDPSVAAQAAAVATVQARVYRCAGSAADCLKTQPSLDLTGKVWQLTTVKPTTFSTSELAAKQPTVRACFLWEAGYPFQKNDEVCDPERSSTASWTCLDALKCSSQGKPGFSRQAELKAVWNLATDAFRIDSASGAQVKAKARFTVAAKPVEGAPTQCPDYDDLPTGTDINAAVGSPLKSQGLTWCDQGRAFLCAEAPQVTVTTAASGSTPAVLLKKYQCCSTSRPSTDKAGCWSLTRQRASVQKLTKAAADTAAGIPNAVAPTGRCLAGPALNAPKLSFQGENALVNLATNAAPVTEGVLKLEDGRACTDDAAWKIRVASATVRPVARLPTVIPGATPSDLVDNRPRNVKVLEATFDGRTLETVLAGAGYVDAQDRQWFLTTLAAFPGVCGDQPAADTLDAKSACRYSFLGLLTFALSGESPLPAQPTMGLAAGYAAQRTDDDVAWWQTAFASRIGLDLASSDGVNAAPSAKACFVAELLKLESTDTTANDVKCALLMGHNAADAAAQNLAAVKAGVEQVITKLYYARGAGPLPLRGSMDYTEFSKAWFGDEATLGATPELLLTWGQPAGSVYLGALHGPLPWAVALWRYVTPAHPWLPSMHEVVSGMWKPRAHEVTAKLGAVRGDFCTMASLLAAMKVVRGGSGSGATTAEMLVQARGLFANVSAAGTASADPTTLLPNAPHQLPHLRNGALGEAYKSLAGALGITALPSGTAAYDYTCAKTAAWPVPGSSDTVSRQKTWLVQDSGATASSKEKCKFTDTYSALSVWTQGDVARCYQDALRDTAVTTLTVGVRQLAANLPTRTTVCQLWRADLPFAYGVCGALSASAADVTTKNTNGCLACTKLALSLCAATGCQNDPTKTQHDVWRCDTGMAHLCAHTDPTSTNTAWVKDTTIVDSATTRATAAQAADDKGKLYRVVEAVVDAAGTQEVDCVSYAEANIALHSVTFKAQLDTQPDAAVAAKNYTATKWTLGKHRPVVYVAGPSGAGPQVRALTCTANDACTSTNSSASTNKPTGTAGSDGIGAWTVEPKKHCRARATFAERYPDCQQGLKSLEAKNVVVAAPGVDAQPAYLAWAAPGADAATGSTEEKATWQTRASQDWAPLTQTTEVADIRNDVAYCKALTPATICNTPTFNASGTDTQKKTTAVQVAEALVRRSERVVGTLEAGALNRHVPAARPLALFVDAGGAICSNLRGAVTVGSVVTKVAPPSYAVRAWHAAMKSAVFLTTAADVAKVADLSTPALVVSSLNANAKNANLIMQGVTAGTSALFNKLVPVAYQTARAESSTQTAYAGLTYLSFLGAVNRAPAFCGTAGSGKFRGLPASAMCARELAGFFAAAVAQTSERVLTKARPTMTTVAPITQTAAAVLKYYEQGFKYLGDPICRGGNDGLQADARGGTAANLTAGGMLTANVLPRCNQGIPASDSFFTAALQCSSTNTAVLPGADCEATLKFSPRGALGLRGVARHYWYAQHVQGVSAGGVAAAVPLASAAGAAKTPTVLETVAADFWLSGLFEWLVPAGGDPAPQHLMTGLWEPSAPELAAGVPEGFGAVMKLREPTACGVNAKGELGTRWSESWVGMRQVFGLDRVSLAAVGDVATDATTYQAAKVVSALHASDKDDCAGADTKHFPPGAFATFPRYYSPTFLGSAADTAVVQHRGLGGEMPAFVASRSYLGGGNAAGANGTCVASSTVSLWPAWRADAYRLCAAANVWTA